jgi:uncharacterized membrane protein YcaP (DUF421 family)
VSIRAWRPYEPADAPPGDKSPEDDHRVVRMTAEAAVWHAMFVEQIPLTEKILRTVIVYPLIAVLFRLTGERALAGMNTFDVIVIFLLSNVVQNAVIGNDISEVGRGTLEPGGQLVLTLKPAEQSATKTMSLN